MEIQHFYGKYPNPFWEDENLIPEILILGSFPSQKSFEAGFYYSNPGYNAFWKILAGVYQEEYLKEKCENLEWKKNFLKKHKIALSDIIISIEAENDNIPSTDNKLFKLNFKYNHANIQNFLKRYPKVRIFATSKEVEKRFIKNFADIQKEIIYLQSPSGSNAKPLKFKIHEWRKAIL